MLLKLSQFLATCGRVTNRCHLNWPRHKIKPGEPIHGYGYAKWPLVYHQVRAISDSFYSLAHMVRPKNK